jgi:membrane associated rhomboid family serine protease
MFLPYKVDVDLARLPVITILVSLICIVVFWNQDKSQRQYQEALLTFCNNSGNIDRSTMTVLRLLQKGEKAHPCTIFLEIHRAPDTTAAIHALAADSKPMRLFQKREDEVQYVNDVLSDAYLSFDRSLPSNLTESLHYDPKQLQVKRMITSTFSHASWGHLIGNLFGFYAFAASVEVIIGSLLFIPTILVMAIVTSIAYSASVAGVEAALPTVGLSGIVFGMMAMLATMAPWIKIRCLFWLIIFFRVIRLPALLLAAWYIGWNFYDMQTIGDKSHINYMAHASGAACGVVLGFIYSLWRPKVIAQIKSASA